MKPCRTYTFFSCGLAWGSSILASRAASSKWSARKHSPVCTSRTMKSVNLQAQHGGQWHNKVYRGKQRRVQVQARSAHMNQGKHELHSESSQYRGASR